MKRLVSILLLLSALASKAESVSTLYIQEFFGQSNGLLWIDTSGHVHKFNGTNTGGASTIYASNIVGIINTSNLPPFQSGSLLLSNFANLANGSGVLTNDGTGTYSWVPVTSSGVSQTPWLSDIDAGGFRLFDVTEVDFIDGATIGSGGVINSASALSYSSLITGYGYNFGTYNGESAGVGSDINLTSANGNVVISSLSDTLTLAGDVNGTFPFETGNGALVTLQSDVSQGTIWSGYVSGDRGTMDFVPEAIDHPEIGLRIAAHSIYGTDDAFFQAIPSSTGYGALEGVGGLGFILATAEGNGPIIFAIDRTEGARLQYNSDTDTRTFLIGISADDGTSSDLQVANSISIQGSQGVSGTTADGSTVTGGLITHIGP